jgi:DNA-binding SARP family transcriptional activator
MLGGFRVSEGSRNLEESAWRLRKAKSLVKLLALAPGHRMHRERVMAGSGRSWAQRRLKVNLSQKIVNLNSDKLDGKDSSEFATDLPPTPR